jgi:hypothetical protein
MSRYAMGMMFLGAAFAFACSENEPGGAGGAAGSGGSSRLTALRFRSRKM